MLAYRKLTLPLFQRCYSWGGPDKEHAASGYFMEFLSNRNANDFFGHLFVYAEERYQFETDTRAEAFLGDGQHRLCTIVLGGLVIYEALQAITAHSHRGAAEQAERLLEEYADDFDILTTSQLEIRVAPGEAPLKLVDVIAQQKRRLAELTAQRERVTEQYHAQLSDIRTSLASGERRVAKNSQTLDRNRKYAQIDQEIKQLQSLYVWRAYRSIEQVLKEESAGADFFDCLARCRVFFERLEAYSLSMVCLGPKRKGGVTLEVLEAQAFEMFAQLNGHTYPLGAGELLESLIQGKAAPGCPSRQLPLPASELRKVLAYFGVEGGNGVAEFAARMMHKTSELKAYQWVKRDLYGAPNRAQVLEQVAGHALRLQEFKTAVGNASEEVAKLYELFFSLMARPVHATYLSRVSAQIGPNPAESVLRAVLKLLVLFELALLHIPKNQRRSKSAEDLAPLDTMEAGLRYVLKHFDAKADAEQGLLPLDALQAKVQTLMAEFPMGAQPFRRHAKLLLVLSDLGKPLAGLAHNWSSYSFEHVIPQKFAKRPADTETWDDALQALAEELQGLEPDEVDATINLLGNGALLDTQTNSGLSNKWPVEKVRITQAKALENSWWNTHWSDVSSNGGGQFGIVEVKERSERLAGNVSRWLFLHDMPKLRANGCGLT